MFYKIYFKIDRAYNKFRRKKRPGFIISLATAIGGAIAASLVGVGVGIGTAIVVGTIAAYATIGISIWGGVSLMRSLGSGKRNMSSGIATSPSYASPVLQTQTNNDLPIPIVEGEVKLAGNRIWQNDNKESTIKRIVAFGYGEIEDFTDIRLNDIPYTEISGCKVEKFYGTADQQISTLVLPGKTNAERAEVVGSLKHLAYLAISVPKSEKIDINYNLTAVVKGRKVRVYNTPNSYTVKYSNNPVWCLLDAMISYNGAGMALLNDGSISDAEIAKQIDLASFIEAAEYCDEIISYYEYTTNFTGTNNNLVWSDRNSGNNNIDITYVKPDLANQVESISLTESFNKKLITVSLATNASKAITTKASDIVNLVNNSAEISALVKIYYAENNNGSGIVQALDRASLVASANSSKPRFAFNMIFDSNFTVRDAIEEFKKNCRGALVTKGDKLQFKIDSPGDVVQVLDKEDIIMGSEVYTPISMEEHYDIIKLEYISPSYEWSKVQAQAELFEYKNEPAIVHSVDIYSITNHQQASLLAWYYLNRKILCPFAYKFSTDYRISSREIGDIITVPSLLMGQTYTGKIVKIADDNSGVYDVTIVPYDPDLYNDELASGEPKVIVTSLSDPYAYPEDIPNFSVAQNMKLLQFVWQEVQGNNITYEIRQGNSWENSSLIAKGLKGNSYTSPLNTKGTLKFWIKAFSGYNYSVNPALDVLQVDYIPDLNIIISENILKNPAGTYNNTYIYNEKLKLNPVSLWQDISPETWKGSEDRYYADTLGLWGPPVETSGSYTSQVYDIGANLDNIVSCDYNVYKQDSNANVDVYLSYSEDNLTWKDDVIVTAGSTGSYKFRYYKVKIAITNPGGLMIYVSNFQFTVDVPDREENYTNREITDANAGITINFANDIESKIASNFVILEPQILATSKSNAAYPVVTASNSSNFTVKLYKNDGTLTTGFVNIRARGY